MKNVINIFKNNSAIDFLIAIFLSHIFYRITFIESISAKFSLINQIKISDVTSQNFFVESPTYTLLAFGLGIENLDTFKIMIYLLFLVSLLFIVLNIQYLGGYSTVFILSGWLITCSWFLGFVDIISVLIMVIISKDILKNNISFLRTGLFFLLLCLNHNAISIGVCVTYLLLTKRESLFKLISIIITSQLLGNFLIQYYLEAINFSGRGRLRFVFNDNVIENAVNFVGSNFLIVLWSGFFGSILIMVLVFNTLPWMEVKKLLISLLIALFFTSIALDTSRIFSLLVVPIIIHTLNLYKNRVDFNKKLAITYTVSLLLVTVVGVFFIHGSVLTSSPMNELENFYDFIPRIVNSVMSTIWK